MKTHLLVKKAGQVAKVTACNPMCVNPGDATTTYRAEVDCAVCCSAAVTIPVPAEFTCPECGAKSWHPGDRLNRWCHHCNRHV